MSKIKMDTKDAFKNMARNDRKQKEAPKTHNNQQNNKSAAAAANMTVVSPPPRRSGRERRKVESIYDEARKASAVKGDESTEEESV